MRHCRLKLFSILALSTLSASHLQAEDITPATSPASDEQQERNAIQFKENITDIVTKNRLNADHVPGMITILNGEDLEARGKLTLHDALNLVPGMDLYFIRQGFWVTSVRGASEVFSSGNMKIMLDGIPFNTPFAVDSIPNMPIEQVDRIEVIRGPGSAIHGEFAYAGVINIITRKNENKVYARFGKNNTYGGGGIVSWVDPTQDLSISLNLAGWRTEGANMQTGSDTLYGRGMSEVSQAPGPTNEAVDYGSGLFNLSYNKFSFNTQYVKSAQGDFFGMGYALPPASNETIHNTDYIAFTANQKLDISGFHANLTLGWQTQHYKGDDSYFYPPEFYVSYPDNLTIVYPDGWIYGTDYEEELFRTGIDITRKVGENHDLLLAYSFVTKEITDVWFNFNLDLRTQYPQPLPFIYSYTGEQLGIARGIDRDIHSVTLQDEYKITQDLTLTSGLRYDYYSDLEEQFSPRLAAVYRLSDKHIIKGQYAHSFRPPTFFEIYASTNPVLAGSTDLVPETNDTFELGYIFKGLDTTWRSTLFHSTLEKVIVIENGIHANGGTSRNWGTEIELEQLLGDFFKLDGNVSYTFIDDADNKQSGVLSAQWLGNIGLMYQPTYDINLVLQYRYVGERNRESTDLRENLDQYHTFDLTGSVFNLGMNGLTLRAGITNLFDEDVRYPAPMEEFTVTGVSFPSYPEDFPRPGRQWWLQMTYEF